MSLNRKAGMLFAAVSLFSGCSDKPKPQEQTVMTSVKIVAVQEKDSMMRWGASGCTTIEYTNGVRRQIGGIYGKVGDTFEVAVDPKWLE